MLLNASLRCACELCSQRVGRFRVFVCKEVCRLYRSVHGGASSVSRSGYGMTHMGMTTMRPSHVEREKVRAERLRTVLFGVVSKLS